MTKAWIRRREAYLRLLAPVATPEDCCRNDRDSRGTVTRLFASSAVHSNLRAYWLCRLATCELSKFVCWLSTRRSACNHIVMSPTLATFRTENIIGIAASHFPDLNNGSYSCERRIQFWKATILAVFKSMSCATYTRVAYNLFENCKICSRTNFSEPWAFYHYLLQPSKSHDTFRLRFVISAPSLTIPI
jgi:hypothetical protein